MLRSCSAACSLLLALAAAAEPQPRKIVLIAGVKSHGPTVHEYLKSVKLLKVLLDTSPNLRSAQLQTEVHFNGWPEDPKTLDSAATIVVISDGQPSDRLPPMPLMTPERMAILERQMRRGCGLVSIHYSTFITYRFAEEAMRWQGGHYEWKPQPPTRPVSLIRTIEASAVLASPDHPVSRGLTSPFRLRDEFYYRLRLNTRDPGYSPVLQIPDLPGTPAEQTVAWTMQRPDGGRGFATSTGHFFANWQNDSFRRLILNAIVWTAGGEVPRQGVQSTYASEDSVNRRLAPYKQRNKALIIAASAAEAAALRQALESEIPRFDIVTGNTRLNRTFKLVIAHGPITPDLEVRLRAYAANGGGVVRIEPSGRWSDRAIESPAGLPFTHLIPPFDVKQDSDSGPILKLDEHGKGRFVTTSLGRDAERIANPGVTQLLLYGSLWAARLR
jgi:type 1 glutamine amidotransferase